jgi:hypothetical protein
MRDEKVLGTTYAPPLTLSKIIIPGHCPPCHYINLQSASAGALFARNLGAGHGTIVPRACTITLQYEHLATQSHRTQGLEQLLSRTVSTVRNALVYV